MHSKIGIGLRVASLLAMAAEPALAIEIDDRLSVGGVLGAALQCRDVSGATGTGDDCEHAVVFQPELSYRPGDAGEVFIKLGFATGNGLNDSSPFVIPPWAADLEDDVKDVNGRGRDHLLAAWYRYGFNTAGGHAIGITLGVIDSTDYLDENAFANDEYVQFMNPALTNGPNVFLPSYDTGAAVEWDAGAWSLRAVWMRVGENDDGNAFDFYGVQAGYRFDSALGTGNYRLVLAAGSRDFFDPAGTRLEDRAGALISIDQEFGERVGAWLRIGWQTDDAAVDYNAIFSGGIDLSGAAWGRDGDNIGLGYAYLSGGSLDVNRTQLAEAYYRWQWLEGLGITADIQYQKDDVAAASGPRGWTVALRAAAEF